MAKSLLGEIEFGQPSFGVVEVFDTRRTCGPPQLPWNAPGAGLVAEDHWLVGHNRSIYASNSTGGRSLGDFSTSIVWQYWREPE